MELSIGHLVEQSGVAARTIREWIRLEMLPRPDGTGPAAVYSREHLLRICTIAALRREGNTLEAIKTHMATMSLREMAKYGPKARPQAAPDVPQASAAGAAFPEGEPAEPRIGAMPHPRLGAASSPAVTTDSALPGRRYALVPLLPGMVLMVDENAAAIVRRAALEIVERYGADRG